MGGTDWNIYILRPTIKHEVKRVKPCFQAANNLRILKYLKYPLPFCFLLNEKHIYT